MSGKPEPVVPKDETANKSTGLTAAPKTDQAGGENNKVTVEPLRAPLKFFPRKKHTTGFMTSDEDSENDISSSDSENQTTTNPADNSVDGNGGDESFVPRRTGLGGSNDF